MRVCRFFLVGLLISTTSGCGCNGGASTLSELKQRALVNEDDEDVPPVQIVPRPVEADPPAVVPVVQPAPVPEPTPVVVADPAPAVAVTPPMPMPVEVPPAKPLPVANAELEGPDDPAFPAALPPPEGTPLMPAVTSVPPSERLPIPDAAEQASGKRILAELYKEEYKKAKTPDEKQALAKTLLAKAKEVNDDPVGEYLLLCLTRDIASGCGDVTLAMQAIDQLSAKYEIALPEAKQAALELLVKSLRSQSAAVTYVSECETLADAALQANDFKQAAKVLALAENVAKRGRMNAQLTSVTQQQKHLAELRTAYTQVPAAEATLVANPQDPDANFEIGRYLCFYTREWATGLPHLAAGSDVKLRVLAQIDISQPLDAKQQADLGDQWYDLSQQQTKTIVREALEARAAYWYGLAQNDLPNGLVKSRVQKRLAELGKAEPGKGSTSSGPGAKPAVIDLSPEPQG